ncbi:helix-turn-helix transcriptional regulator [Oceanobacillus kimchii]|uniref:helix-turn-helix transcriptional regulator n=1 Tax=Oceanobacillus kimchii TaxID=746691 RepID=UPI003C7469FA
MSNNLRRVRLEKGFKDVEKLSSKLGISASYYYKIEKGNRTPGIYLAKNIADILEHTVDDLFFNQKLDEMSNEHKQAI